MTILRGGSGGGSFSLLKNLFPLLKIIDEIATSLFATAAIAGAIVFSRQYNVSPAVIVSSNARHNCAG